MSIQRNHAIGEIANQEFPMRTSPFRTGTRQSLLILILAILVSSICLIVLEELEYFGLLLVASLLMFGLVLKRGWLIYLTFFSLIAFRLDRAFELSGWGFVSDVLYLPDLLFSFLVIVLAGLCMRYLTIAKYARTYCPVVDSKLSESVAIESAVPKSAVPESVKEQGSNKVDPTIKFQFPSLLGGRWLLIPASIFLAVVLLSVFPLDIAAGRRLAITPEGTRLIFLAFFMFICWFSCSTIVSTLARWKMDRGQAGIHARSLIAKEFWNESYSLEKRRAKIRQQEGE